MQKFFAKRYTEDKYSIPIFFYETKMTAVNET